MALLLLHLVVNWQVFAINFQIWLFGCYLSVCSGMLPGWNVGAYHHVTIKVRECRY